MSDWNQFDHPEGLFSISYPPRWRRVPPVSSIASLSCQSGDESALVEVVCFSTDPSKISGRALIEKIADDIDQTTRASGVTRYRVIARNSFPFGGIDHCISLLMAYRDERQSDVEISSEYFIIGFVSDALYVALKSTTGLFHENLTDFEDMLGTLSTPWMEASGPPNLTAGTGSRPTNEYRYGGGLPEEIRSRLEPEITPPLSSGYIWWLIGTGALLVTTYYLLRHV